MWYRLRAAIPQPVKRAMRDVAYAYLVSDMGSFLTYRNLSREARGHGSGVRRIRLRPLGDRDIELRRGTSDAITVFTTFLHRFHRPPAQLELGSSPVFLDLGSNIGLTVADYAVRYPNAHVVGVELDPNNAAVCRRNIAPWSARCTILQGAVWWEDGELSYEASFGGEDGFSVSAARTGNAGSRMVTVPAYSIATILERCGNPPVIDFVKMDIEGAEKYVLEKRTAWLDRVRAIKVELHDDYTKEQALAALRRRGFEAWPDRYHPEAVVGVKPA